MPLQQTAGNNTYDAYGGGAASVPVYIEDVFSTYLYTGTGAAQTITNGIDLSGKGGLVWIKDRSAGNSHRLADTTRGNTNYISSNNTTAQVTSSTDITAFNATGFSLGTGATLATNDIGTTYASWTFRKQPKFFDIVTYTGDGTESRVISHNLGSAPGCIIIKRTDSTSNWFTFHRSATQNLYLNTTTAGVGGLFFIASANSTTFTLGTNTTSNATGGTYVAYLFANDAGGFGLTGTDNVITCGSCTTDAVGNLGTVNLGYEPQWILFKNISSTQEWWLFDTMRGLGLTAATGLLPNSTSIEQYYSGTYVYPTATGFAGAGNFFGTSQTVIYIAIRRGPMKVPTVGTSVYATDTVGSTSPRPPGLKSGFPVDWSLTKDVTVVNNWFDATRLLSATYLSNNLGDAEGAVATYTFDYQSGWLNTTSILNRRGYMFQRAPGFFDVVCYTGNNAVQNIAHNLTVVPELMIVKGRNVFSGWRTYVAPLGATKYVQIQSTNAAQTYPVFNDTAPTSTVFTAGTDISVNAINYVAYLFATCAGVSKVGSYTGTGATQTIDCGFTGGARFVLIKRTDSTGDWYVWDTARGMVSGTDPSLLLNTTAAEVNANSVYTTGVGFQIVSTAAGINASGGTYIFLAVA